MLLKIRRLPRAAVGCFLVLQGMVLCDGAPEARPTAWLSAGKHLPLAFEPAGVPGRFVARAPGFGLNLSADTVNLWLRAPGAAAGFQDIRGLGAARSVAFRFLGADAAATVQPEVASATRVSYLVGRDPASWRQAVPAHERVRVREAYAGVDLVYYGNDRQLEFDCVVAPGADPGCVRFAVEGADGVRLTESGDLAVRVGDRELLQRRPVAYQEIGGEKRSVAAQFVVGEAGNGPVSFKLGDYDPARPLVIDPLVTYASYFGGGLYDACTDVAVDPSGYLFVVGETASIDLMVQNAWSATNQTIPSQIFLGNPYGNDVFVAKLTPDGTSLVFSTYLGGKDIDAATSVALGPDGVVWVTGLTMSDDFPVTQGAVQSSIGGIPYFGVYQPDAFVTALSPDGQDIEFSTYLGGDDEDQAVKVVVDAESRVFVGGDTKSTNFLQQVRQETFGFPFKPFLVCLDFAHPTNSFWQLPDPWEARAEDRTRTLLYALTLAPGGGVWFGGESLSPTLLVTNAFQPAVVWTPGASLTAGIGYFGRLDLDGVVRRLSYFGGTSGTAVSGLDTTAGGDLVLAGGTSERRYLLQTPDRLTSGLSAGLFDTRMRESYGVGVNVEVSATGHTTGLWGDPGITVVETNQPWAAGVWYHTSLDYSLLSLRLTNTADALVTNRTVVSVTNSPTLITNFVYELVATNEVSEVVTQAQGVLRFQVWNPANGDVVLSGTQTGLLSSTLTRFGVSRLMHSALAGAAGRAPIDYSVDNVQLLQGTNGVPDQVIFAQNFTTDPGLVSSDTNAVWWDRLAGTLHGTHVDTNGPQAYLALPAGFDSEQPWRLEFDHVIHTVWPDPPLSGLLTNTTVASAGIGTGRNIFVARMNPDGTAVKYATVVAGNGVDVAHGILVGSDESVTVAGSTTSTDFPVVDAPQPGSGGGTDGVLFRLSADGAALDFSTYLGGGETDELLAVRAAPQGGLWVAGRTVSADWADWAGPYGLATNLSGTTSNFVKLLARDVIVDYGAGDGLLVYVGPQDTPRLELLPQPGGSVVARWPASLPEGYRLQSLTSLFWTNVILLNDGGTEKFWTNRVVEVQTVEQTNDQGGVITVTVTNISTNYMRYYAGGTNRWVTNQTVPPWSSQFINDLVNTGGTNIWITNRLTNILADAVAITNYTTNSVLRTTNGVSVRTITERGTVKGTTVKTTNVTVLTYPAIVGGTNSYVPRWVETPWQDYPGTPTVDGTNRSMLVTPRGFELFRLKRE